MAKKEKKEKSNKSLTTANKAPRRDEPRMFAYRLCLQQSLMPSLVEPMEIVPTVVPMPTEIIEPTAREFFDSEVAYYKGHTMDVFSVAFNPTRPGLLASGSGDATVRLWDLDSGSKDAIVLQHNTPQHERMRDITSLDWSVSLFPGSLFSLAYYSSNFSPMGLHWLPALTKALVVFGRIPGNRNVFFPSTSVRFLP